MRKRNKETKDPERLQRILEDHKRYVENQALLQPLIDDAKRQIDLVSWDQIMTFPVTGAFGKLLCVYDSIPTIELILEMIEDLINRKVDRGSYSYRVSTLINFVFWRKMQDSLQELTWEISELIMLEDIFEGFSAYEALARRQRIPPWFLKTSKMVADKLRKERWTAINARGMRGKDRSPRKRRLQFAPAHETNRLKMLAAIMKVRSKSEEEQDKILNSKSKLAEEGGISYHTLRRSEIQGGWTTEDLIAQVKRGRASRAGKK